MSQLLQWSLKHQDLDALHERANAIRRGAALPGSIAADGNEGDVPAGSLPEPLRPAAGAERQPPPRLTEERRAELQEAMSHMMPDQAKQMREALELAVDASLPNEERE